MIVVAKKDIEGICEEGQRMYVTRFAGRNLNKMYMLHISYDHRKVFTLAWLAKHFEIVEE